MDALPWRLRAISSSTFIISIALSAARLTYGSSTARTSHSLHASWAHFLSDIVVYYSAVPRFF